MILVLLMAMLPASIPLPLVQPTAMALQLTMMRNAPERWLLYSWMISYMKNRDMIY